MVIVRLTSEGRAPVGVLRVLGQLSLRRQVMIQSWR